ncbi:hypothetical protein Cgig2_020498 [Carnegiea gigantea]|uniref:Uncharacterized protein n=1 Tax=Carnegiea gigantea TaxID=171969 RepID=A0A9Q1QGW6_9CARY|nr:hypothetical protein Cgig2_020498 [Carnegiea gigantea]
MGHRRSTWGSLNLGSPGAAINFAHRRPVFFLGRPPRFLFRSRLFLGFLTWLRLVLRVLAFSITAGEVSTGDPVAGDLAQRSRVVFPRFARLFLVSTLLKPLLKWLAVSIASGGVLAGVTVAGDFSSHRKVAGVQLLPKMCFTGEPECFLRSVPHIVATKSSKKVNEAVQELPFSKLMQMDKGKQRVVTKLGLRASSSGIQGIGFSLIR